MELSARRLIIWVDTTFSLLILTTYSVYYALGHGRERPFPSMSETWDFPPGSYLSRFFLPLISVGLAGIGLCIYTYRMKMAQKYMNERALLSMNIIGAIGICGVGSVSDIDYPALHFLFAIMAFVLMDAYITILYLVTPPNVIQGTSLLLSVVSKIRFFPYPCGCALGIFEWVDAMSMCSFLTSYVFINCIDEKIVVSSEI